MPLTSDIISCVVAILIPVLAGSGVGIFVGKRAKDDYDTISRPSWSPPKQLFGPVWTILYTLMGLASWFVWRERKKLGLKSMNAVNIAIGLYIAQLIVNLMWSPVYFLGYRRAALAIILLSCTIKIITHK